MLKYVVVVMLSPILLTNLATSQPKTNPGNTLQGERLAAAREAINSGSVIDPQQRLEREQIARVIVQRQMQLRVDTEKLVALTAELKQNVDKAGPNILSMDVIKKAQEIQKLAKSIQDKMKNAY